MKRINAITFLLITMIYASFAQEFNKTSLQLDMGASVTFPNQFKVETMTNIDGHPVTKYYPCSGYFAEIIGAYYINQGVNLQSGITFNFSRLRVIDKAGVIKNKGRINKSYIQVPLLLNFQVSKDKPFNLAAGLYLGYLLEARQKGESILNLSEVIVVNPNDPLLLNNSQFDYNDDISSNFIKYDFGLSLQASYAWSLNNKYTLLFFTRFNSGLVDIDSNDRISNTYYTANKFINLNLLFGVGFKI
jgi:hypothetical protein